MGRGNEPSILPAMLIPTVDGFLSNSGGAHVSSTIDLTNECFQWFSAAKAAAESPTHAAFGVVATLSTGVTQTSFGESIEYGFFPHTQEREQLFFICFRFVYSLASVRGAGQQIKQPAYTHATNTSSPYTRNHSRYAHFHRLVCGT